jgi:ribosomal protein S18 acetylase RimI-like enzyme
MSTTSGEIGSLIDYRAFRNADPPQLAEIWRSQAGKRALMQPMSAAVFERYVLSKPTFDPAGLIVADAGGRLVGFAHAGFGPTADRSGLAREAGVTSVVLVKPEADSGVAAELLSRAELYLRGRGAKALYGGGRYPLSPFYYGLYGGSELSGVPDSDPESQAAFAAAGYRAAGRSLVLERDLARFRPAVDRQQIQIRRTTRVEAQVDPPPANWWDAVIFEPFDRTRWTLVEHSGGPPLASVYLWNLETMIGTWGVHAVGIVDLEVLSERRRRGLATNLLGEAFRQLQTQGITLAEVHVPETNAAALGVFRHLGFEQVDATTLYCKE